MNQPVTIAPATGRLIAELVANAPAHIDVTPYKVERFS
jgi:glycine/D-amino acid oxidase-like deaminating enzyme